MVGKGLGFETINLMLLTNFYGEELAVEVHKLERQKLIMSLSSFDMAHLGIGLKLGEREVSKPTDQSNTSGGSLYQTERGCLPLCTCTNPSS